VLVAASGVPLGIVEGPYSDVPGVADVPDVLGDVDMVLELVPVPYDEPEDDIPRCIVSHAESANAHAKGIVHFNMRFSRKINRKAQTIGHADFACVRK
jgi:hypothetical protein